MRPGPGQGPGGYDREVSQPFDICGMFWRYIFFATLAGSPPSYVSETVFRAIATLRTIRIMRAMRRSLVQGAHG